MEILERGPLLLELSRLLHEAGGGAGRLVFVGGEAGVGKSVLVRRFGEMVAASARVLAGACDPLSTPRPLGPFLDVAGQLPHRGLLDLVERPGSRDRLFRAFLSELSEGGLPSVVVLEDVHWADEATLDLLRFLGRRAGDTRALLVATYRDDEAGDRHPLRVVLGDLATSPAVARVAVEPLSLEAVRTLAAGRRLDPVALHRQTGGNAFFVTEILASGSGGLPGTVRDAVLARAARLPAAARAALEAAAVIGFRVEPWLLQAAAEPAPGAVDACVASGMLRADGAGLAFRHELTRQAVLEAVPPGRALAVHRAVLAALRASPAADAEVSRLAHHAEAAGDAAAVLEFALLAARRAALLSAHREAAAQYERALRFAGGRPEAERAALLEAMAYEYYLTDRIPEAIRARRAALELWRSIGDPLREGDDLRWLSRLSWFTGDPVEAERTARLAIEVLERLPPGRELAMAYSNRAQLRMLADDVREAVRWGERAIALAESLDDVTTLAHALNNVGTARVTAGDGDGGSLLERSLRLSLAADLEEHAARAYTNLGSTAAKHFRLDEAERWLQEGIAYSTERDLDSWRLYMGGWHAVVLLHRGRWAEAGAVAASVLGHPSVSPISAIQALVVLGRIAARTGEGEAAPHLDRALALADPTRELQRIGPARAARAEAAWLAGGAAAAAAEARAALDLALANRDGWLAGELLAWLRRGGEPAAAPEWVARPFALELAGDAAGAAAEWARLGCPYEAARALAGSARPEELRDALAEMERLGARAAAALLARRMRALGVRGIPRGPRPSTRRNPAHLTAREVEILGLLAEGMQNADIARRLFLSPKTVDHHVSAVLAKLGVHTRTEAVREAARLRILQYGEPGSAR